jgi:hypothetical protein
VADRARRAGLSVPGDEGVVIVRPLFGTLDVRGETAFPHSQGVAPLKDDVLLRVRRPLARISALLRERGPISLLGSPRPLDNHPAIAPEPGLLLAQDSFAAPADAQHLLIARAGPDPLHLGLRTAARRAGGLGVAGWPVGEFGLAGGFQPERLHDHLGSWRVLRLAPSTYHSDCV